MWTAFDIEMMHEALAEASAAMNIGEIPVGALITKDGKIIARGHNLRERTKDPTAHAEITVIRAAANALGDWRLTGCTLYVTLEPCPMCAGAIVAARLSKLIYGAYDARSGCAGSIYRITEDPAFNHCCPADGGLMAQECQLLIQSFLSGKRG